MNSASLQTASMRVARQHPPAPDLSIEHEPWMDAALCTQVDPDMFYPEGRGASVQQAKRVCAACDVRAECLLFALAGRERFGVWGGLSERERHRLLPPAQRGAA